MFSSLLSLSSLFKQTQQNTMSDSPAWLLEHTAQISKDLLNFFKLNEKKEGKLQLLTLHKIPLNGRISSPNERLLSQERKAVERGMVKSLLRVLLSQNWSGCESKTLWKCAPIKVAFIYRSNRFCLQRSSLATTSLTLHFQQLDVTENPLLNKQEFNTIRIIGIMRALRFLWQHLLQSQFIRINLT